MPFGIRRFDSLGTDRRKSASSPNLILQTRPVADCSVPSHASRLTYSAPFGYLRVPLYSSPSRLAFAIFCCLGTSHLIHILELLPFSPSRFPGTMASADFSAFSRTSLYGLGLPCFHGFTRTTETSPDKSDNFHPMRPVHLHREVRAVLDFALTRKLVRLAHAFYVLPVRRAGILPPTSF